ncbi:DUF3592 domain-containing protein [Streptomyces sp. V4I2]|uniref:DUF3592 domain-containing protein n=1 Tax=Streptomyces sp. V4I2 TaxID=3042280 RepID=UPI00277DFDA3|nr:DUF3592 domain-containing protein [Streptomyces sp. V4I2]MDQ1047849.1 hypothetical protein [Streptomyces sp. V4I2]
MNSDAAFIVSCILQVLGFAAMISHIGIFRDYRRLRNLARHGVEGEAVSTAQDYAGAGQYRVQYEVRLADGESKAEFHALQRVMAELGTVVPVVYDRTKPQRAKTGFLEDINYRPDQLSVFVFGYGGVAAYLMGVVLLVLS